MTGDLKVAEGPRPGAAHRGGAVQGSRGSPMRCPTGELNGFPRRKSIATAAAANDPKNQLTATAGADLSRDVPDGPRGGGAKEAAGRGRGSDHALALKVLGAWPRGPWCGCTHPTFP